MRRSGWWKGSASTSTSAQTRSKVRQRTLVFVACVAALSVMPGMAGRAEALRASDGWRRTDPGYLRASPGRRLPQLQLIDDGHLLRIDTLEDFTATHVDIVDLSDGTRKRVKVDPRLSWGMATQLVGRDARVAITGRRGPYETAPFTNMIVSADGTITPCGSHDSRFAVTDINPSGAVVALVEAGTVAVATSCDATFHEARIPDGWEWHGALSTISDAGRVVGSVDRFGGTTFETRAAEWDIHGEPTIIDLPSRPFDYDDGYRVVAVQDAYVQAADGRMAVWDFDMHPTPAGFAQFTTLVRGPDAPFHPLRDRFAGTGPGGSHGSFATAFDPDGHVYGMTEDLASDGYSVTRYAVAQWDANGRAESFGDRVDKGGASMLPTQVVASRMISTNLALRRESASSLLSRGLWFRSAGAATIVQPVDKALGELPHLDRPSIPFDLRA
jgi:hypothetical protein